MTRAGSCRQCLHKLNVRLETWIQFLRLAAIPRACLRWRTTSFLPFPAALAGCSQILVTVSSAIGTRGHHDT
jgi:hypothetical protein